MVTRFFYFIHRILGTLLSILFLIWFLSAFVMMYHRFPRVSTREQLLRQEQIYESHDSLPEIDSLLQRIPQEEKLRKLTLDRMLGQTVFHIRTAKGTYNLPLNPSDSLPKTDDRCIRQIAALWCPSPIAKIDTLHALDQWIPFGELKKEMPIYKIHFADKEKTELYLSSRNGDALQCSTRSERFWAWLGAIPHWVYFTWLRQDAGLWSKTVIWLSGLGCLMVIAGGWVAVDVWRRSRRSRHHRFSPYRKRWYHWHYVTGIVFGIFVLAFTFSGMMSLADIPEWIHKPALKGSPARMLRGNAPLPGEYMLDYRSVAAAYPEALQIEWSNFREHPYYTVTDGYAEWYVDATDSLPHPLQLSKEEILRGVESIYSNAGQPHSMPIHMKQINRFETYYRDMSNMYRGRSQLPVWKISVNDADRSVFYIHPETGMVRYVNTSARWKYWTYTALHRMRLPGLNSNTALRKTVLWVLLLGGSAVSVTGVALAVGYLRRKCRKKRSFHKY